MLKWLVIFTIYNLSCVLCQWGANSHPLLFQSNKDKFSPVSMSKVVKHDRDDGPPQPSRKLQDTGYAVNCGNPKHTFTLSWDPKVVNPSRGVVFNLKIIAAIPFTTGSVDISVYVGGSTSPFITDTVPLNCGIIHQKFPQLKCPIKTGDTITLSYSQSDLTALPPGSYTLKADVKSGNDDFICAKLVVDIKE